MRSELDWREAAQIVERGEAGGGLSGGLRASWPVVAGYVPAAVAFGVAARGAGLSTAETVVMSLVVYSGASQFAIVGLVAAGASWLVMAGTALVLGARHMLYGPALAPRLRLGAGWSRPALAAFGITDEVFAVASERLARGPEGLGWLLGLEAGAYVSWALGSWLGAAAGTAAVDALPLLAPALGFALPALFVALLVAMTRPAEAGQGRRGAVIGATLAAAAVAAALYLAGLESWSVPAAGISGPVIGLLFGGRANEN